MSCFEGGWGWIAALEGGWDRIAALEGGWDQIAALEGGWDRIAALYRRQVGLDCHPEGGWPWGMDCHTS